MTTVIVLATPAAGNQQQLPTMSGDILPVVPTPITIPTGATPARAFGQGGNVTLTASAQVIASASFTPATSGKMTVFVEGIVDNNDSTSTVRPVTVAITSGSGTSPVLYTTPTYNMQGSNHNNSNQVSLAIPLDLLGSPTTFPVGTPAEISVTMTGDASAQLSVPANGCTVYVAEAIG